jgi:hypothetical protein
VYVNRDSGSSTFCNVRELVSLVWDDYRLISGVISSALSKIGRLWLSGSDKHVNMQEEALYMDAYDSTCDRTKILYVTI